jgi:tetratricopeptide (TPR) repeat protein
MYESQQTYGRGTRFFFGFMAFIMILGYPLLLLTNLPSFQSLFLGSSAGASATQRQVDDARVDIRDLKCLEKPAPKGDDLRDCKDALRKLGTGYQALATPDQTATTMPQNSTRYTDLSIVAFNDLYNLDKNDDESKQALASAYSNSQDFEKALPLFRELAKEKKDNPDYVGAWAQVAQKANLTAEAITAYRALLKLTTDDTARQDIKDTIKQIQDSQQSGGAGAGGLGGLSGLSSGGGNLPISIG